MIKRTRYWTFEVVHGKKFGLSIFSLISGFVYTLVKLHKCASNFIIYYKIFLIFKIFVKSSKCLLMNKKY